MGKMKRQSVSILVPMDPEVSKHALSTRDRIVNGRGAATRLGVEPSVFANWRRRHADFPAPLDFPGVEGIPLYDIEEIWSWYGRFSAGRAGEGKK